LDGLFDSFGKGTILGDDIPTMAMLANFVTKLTMTVGVFLTTLGTSDDESYNMKLEKVQHTLRSGGGLVVR